MAIQEPDLKTIAQLALQKTNDGKLRWTTVRDADADNSYRWIGEFTALSIGRSADVYEFTVASADADATYGVLVSGTGGMTIPFIQHLWEAAAAVALDLPAAAPQHSLRSARCGVPRSDPGAELARDGLEDHDFRSHE